jgi:hypothetical protein
VRPFSTISAFFACLVLFIALVATAIHGFSYRYMLHANEWNHIAQATQFVETARAKDGHLPSNEEFSNWTDQMDLRGARYDGIGFRFISNCGSKELDFCFEFWNGDTTATYKSWQSDKSVASVDMTSTWVLFCVFLGLSLMLLKFLIRNEPTIAGKYEDTESANIL